jgi:hypothetical protein
MGLLILYIIAGIILLKYLTAVHDKAILSTYIHLKGGWPALLVLISSPGW